MAYKISSNCIVVVFDIKQMSLEPVYDPVPALTHIFDTALLQARQQIT